MRRLSFAAAAALLVFFGPLPVLAEGPQPAGAESAANADTFKALGLFSEVFKRVRGDYVDSVTDDQLIEAAVNGMLTSLDPHSSYMNAKSFKDMQVQTRGEFGGLGLEVQQQDGFIKVIAPIDETPSAKAGIKAGDLILAIDGESLASYSLQEAVDKMRGAVGTNIKLTIKRDSEDRPFDLTITRAIIKIVSVRGRLERDTIAYLRIASFAEQTGNELRAMFKKLKAEAKDKITGVVLDLRSNPGGLLDQSVSVTEAFIDKGEVVSTRGRRTEEVQRYSAHGGDITGGLPLVVLIDGGSASASEIVAGALQDHHRAVLLGTRSFGKGSVQTIVPLPGNGAMRLTTARYYTPSGRSIQAKGIDPDILVEPAKVERLNLGERLRESDLRGALKNPENPAKPVRGDASKDGGETGTKPADGKPEAKGVDGKTEAKAEPVKLEDYQLTRALDLLKGMSFFKQRASAD